MSVIRHVLFIYLFSISLSVQAGLSLHDAFDSLVSKSHAGVYQSQARGYMSAGSYSVHFPSKTMDIINISPPSVSAGCAGISVFKGGFSYISQDEFISLLKGIASNSLGYIFQISLKTLCPVCSTVASSLQKAAQVASKFAINQCQFAMGLVNSAVKSSDTLDAYINGAGASAQADSNAENDFLAGLTSFAGHIGDAFDSINKKIDSISDAGTKEQAYNKLPVGNTTWKALSGLSDIQKIFIQSLIGTSLSGENVGTGAVDRSSIRTISPTLNAKDLARVFMYGAKAMSNKGVYLNECDHSVKSISSAPNNSCGGVKKVKLIDSTWYKNTSERKTSYQGVSISDSGFYGITYAILFQAINNIENNDVLGTQTSVTLPAQIYGGKGIKIMPKFTKAQIESFLGVSPLPLYRAINIAAVYPDISESMIANISNVVASHYAIAYLEQEIFDLKEVGNSLSGGVGISKETFDSLQRALRELGKNVDKQMSLLLSELQSNRAWSAQVNEVQALVYSEVLSEGLGDNAAFSLGIEGGV